MKYLGRTQDELWLLEEKHGNKECPEFFENMRRLESGEPVDYVIGFTEFLGCKIDLSHHPMIPRHETEFWLDQALKLIPENESKILDIFSGSGCIGVAILKNRPDTRVDFGEKDPQLVLQIQKNIIDNIENTSRARVFETDVFSNIPDEKYDFIFANPPYISHDRKWQVARPVMEHEPHLALFTDDNGLFFVKKLLEESPRHLSPKGMLFIEFDAWQKDDIEKIVSDSLFFEGEFWKDQFSKWRVCVCTLKY